MISPNLGGENKGGVGWLKKGANMCVVYSCKNVINKRWGSPTLKEWIKEKHSNRRRKRRKKDCIQVFCLQQSFFSSFLFLICFRNFLNKKRVAQVQKKRIETQRKLKLCIHTKHIKERGGNLSTTTQLPHQLKKRSNRGGEEEENQGWRSKATNWTDQSVLKEWLAQSIPSPLARSK